MTPEVDRARAVMPEAFDVLLGGINTHGTQPIGEFGRDHLMGIWREVQATTGQAFGFALPTPLIYNSTLPCIAVQAVREVLGESPFDYLHELQRRFFVDGVDINNLETLAEMAAGLGVGRDAFLHAAGSEKVRAEVRFQFETSGTSAPMRCRRCFGKSVEKGGSWRAAIWTSRRCLASPSSPLVVQATDGLLPLGSSVLLPTSSASSSSQCRPFWCTFPPSSYAGDIVVAERAKARHEQGNLHLDSKSKRKLQRAVAERVFEPSERIALPAADWKAFQEVLFNPPTPNAVLKRAARRYRGRMDA